MGPRLFSRGEPARPPRPLQGRRASMGPRLFSRGEATWYRDSFFSVSALQWGRGFSAAESSIIVNDKGLQNLLQWGRGFSAAERRHRNAAGELGKTASMGPRLFSRGEDDTPAWSRPGEASFNGAAAFQPRRVVSGAAPTGEKSGFNGAAAFQPRRGWWTRQRAPTRSSFNGAAAFQPRRASIILLTNPISKASMGPRLFSRGEGLCRMRISPGTFSLQWGRGFSAAERTELIRN